MKKYKYTWEQSDTYVYEFEAKNEEEALDIINDDFNFNQGKLVGGDFNSSETFDYMWKNGPSGNKEVLDRMESLGLTECLKSHNGQLTPTFKNPSNGKIIHQLDHLFVTDGLNTALERCFTKDKSTVFDESLSDHLPIIGIFKTTL